MKNLLESLPESLSEELSDVLVHNTHVRIERIVSTGQCSNDSFWYDQDEHEWVTVLAGEAKLMFEDEPAVIHMKPGDCVNIVAHRRHRVEWTTADEPTVWLAVFYKSD